MGHSNLSSSFNKPDAHEIYGVIRQWIMRLELAPGSRITETQLANYFRVSRTPVRAALQRLEADGFMHIKSKLGCFVRAIHLDEICDCMAVRLTLEQSVLDAIVQRDSKQDLIELASLWHPELRCFGGELSDSFRLAEDNFHADLARLSQNTALLHYLNDINMRVKAVVELAWANHVKVDDIYHDHYRICQHLLNNELQKAQAAMAEHFQHTLDALSNITLGQLGSQSSPLERD